ncbi:MAG: hypothetical protein P8L44_13260 [Opitutales bacterium]|nr:hypothetical protein [Opitutales bacterium]MDG2168880.1 hypothetical protein [Opitutales bacterium]
MSTSLKPLFKLNRKALACEVAMYVCNTWTHTRPEQATRNQT